MRIIDISLNELGNTSTSQIDLGQQYENNDLVLNFNLDETLNKLNKYTIFAHQKQTTPLKVVTDRTLILPIVNNTLKITNSVTSLSGNWKVYFMFREHEVDTTQQQVDINAQTNERVILFEVDGIVKPSAFKPSEIDNNKLDENIQVVYDDLLSLQKELHEMLDGTSGLTTDILKQANSYTDDRCVDTYNYTIQEANAHAEELATNMYTQVLSTNVKGGSGEKSTVMGSGCVASGKDSVAIGRNTQAISRQAFAEGDSTVAGNMDSYDTSEISPVNDYGVGSGTHAEGVGTFAKGVCSHAEGYKTIASGRSSHASGEETVASGIISTAFGSSTVASGIVSTAFGIGTHAYADNQFVIGRWNDIDAGNLAFVIGNGTGKNDRKNLFAVTSDGDIICDGKDKFKDEILQEANAKITLATSTTYNEVLRTLNTKNGTGEKSTVEGDGCIASGYASHAQNQCTQALGDFSTACGNNTIANEDNQFVIGAYNQTDTSSIFIIGGGDNISRRNILTVNKNGDLTVNGTIKAQGYDYLPAYGEDWVDYAKGLCSYRRTTRSGGSYGWTGYDGDGYFPYLTDLAYGDFAGDIYLTNLDCPSLTDTSMWMCKDCVNLKNVWLPQVTSIGLESFKGCTSLKYLDFPKVTEIGDSAFQDCTSLIKVCLFSTEKVKLENAQVFDGCINLKEIQVPKDLVEEYKNDEVWGALNVDIVEFD